jgi:hypothetical protein
MQDDELPIKLLRARYIAILKAAAYSSAGELVELRALLAKRDRQIVRLRTQLRRAKCEAAQLTAIRLQ